ncbi:MAG: hypothetical protein HQL03_09115 [Nitrospirae bacterium]|nr:hypothetical protein [Nitrospirota bacterium]
MPRNITIALKEEIEILRISMSCEQGIMGSRGLVPLQGRSEEGAARRPSFFLFFFSSLLFCYGKKVYGGIT